MLSEKKNVPPDTWSENQMSQRTHGPRTRSHIRTGCPPTPFQIGGGKDCPRLKRSLFMTMQLFQLIPVLLVTCTVGAYRLLPLIVKKETTALYGAPLQSQPHTAGNKVTFVCMECRIFSCIILSYREALLYNLTTSNTVSSSIFLVSRLCSPVANSTL